jgi:hypothetical protein
MGWNWMDVAVAAGANDSKVGGPEISAYFFPAQGTQHVIYVAEGAMCTSFGQITPAGISTT